jgi:hypothetical protein
MAAGDNVIGLDGKFYYGAAGSTAATEATNVDNVRLNLSAQTATRVRRGKTWQMTKPIVLEATVEFEVTSIEGDAFLSSLTTAFMNKGKIALYPQENGGSGLDADYYVTNFSRSEGNTEINTYSVTCAPTDETRDPAWG